MVAKSSIICNKRHQNLGGKKQPKGVKPITPLKKSDSKYVKYTCKIEPKLVQKQQKALEIRTFCCINLSVIIWWAIKDSNLGPSGYEPDALTN